ncbi:MAG: response regulator [Oscillatoriophycideae cyanobacterium NC_groundwater_1537_Pr4_S-0.65um_50_18]|nr:response regulator [Oscillatoriophycideae cyanobacterium NC_groundwater_1537_Pr4_S-0.65um_50_18]
MTKASKVKTEAAHCLAGGGEMGALMRNFDWSLTPLGVANQWSESLKISVSLCLQARFPIVIYWGKDLTLLYNDAWKPFLGAKKHPYALGRPCREIWAEIWDVVGGQLEQVMATGQAIGGDDLQLLIDRDDKLEETYFTYSYSPILEAGEVGGILNVVTETTHRVLNERRMQTLHRLASQVRQVKTIDQAAECVMQTLAQNTADIPFALLYLITPDGTQAKLCKSAPLEIDLCSCRTDLAPVDLATIDLAPGARQTDYGSLASLIQSKQAAVLQDLTQHWETVPSGQWPIQPQQALVLPLRGGQESLVGFLVFGINPYRPLDPDYRTFFDMIAEDVSTALSNAATAEDDRQRTAAIAQVERTLKLSQVMSQAKQPGLHFTPSACTPSVRTEVEALALALVSERDRLRLEVAEREQTEAKLQRYKDLFEHAGQGLVIGHADNETLGLMNAAFARMHGYRIEELVGRSILTLFPSDCHEQIQAAIRLANAMGHYAVESKHVRKDGTVFSVWIDMTAVKDPQGQVRYRIVSVQDITALKQAEVEREKLLTLEQTARQAAETANQIRDQFLAVLSHELRTPLNPILGWAKLLKSGLLDATKTQIALATIERNAQIQAQLIEDLLDIARILEGKLALAIDSVDLRFVVSAAQETVRLAADAKHIELRTILEPNVSVLGDVTRLQQVVWNLLSNAVKFTPQGGQVEVRVAQVQDQAQIQVRDTGKGICPEFLPYVFDRFRQADGATTRQFGGLGLGLAIVRQIVELHGGTVSADSLGEGQGSTFTVTLPATASQASLSAAAIASSDLRGVTALVVDDEADSRELVVCVLQQSGATTLSACSASEALQTLRQQKPDLLISDIGMPETDGYMLIRQVRSLPPEQGGQIPAIAVTAYATDTDRQLILQAGFQRHVTKPIDPIPFTAIVASLVKLTQFN